MKCPKCGGIRLTRPLVRLINKGRPVAPFQCSKCNHLWTIGPAKTKEELNQLNQLKLAESRLSDVRESIALMMANWKNGMPMKTYDLDTLAEIVDPSPMKRGGRDAFIKKHWGRGLCIDNGAEDENADTEGPEPEGAGMTYTDESRFADLRLRFWRSPWQARTTILVDLKLLPAGHDRPLPQVMERRALDQLRSTSRLDELEAALDTGMAS